MDDTRLYETVPGLEAPRLEPVKTVVRLCKKHRANIVTYFRHHLSNAPDELVRVIRRVLQPADHAVLGQPEAQVRKNGSLFEGVTFLKRSMGSSADG